MMYSPGTHERDDTSAGQIERLEIGLAFMSVFGWVTRQDNDAVAEVVVDYRGEALAAGPFQPEGQGRREVKEFGVAVPIDIRTFDVSALSVRCRNLVLGITRQTRIIPAGPRGFIDVALASRVVGWVESANVPYPHRPLLIFAGVLELPVSITDFRADVRDAGLSLSGQVGFAMEIEDLAAALENAVPGITAQLDGKISVELRLEEDLLATSLIILGKSVLGNFEGYRDGALLGWAVHAEQPSAIAEVDVLLDGVHFTRMAADQQRNDLKKQGLSKGLGGFRLPMMGSPTGDTLVEIDLRVGRDGISIKGSPTTLELPLLRRRERLADRLVDDVANPEIAVVVPIYNAPEDVRRCLAALVRHTTWPASLILIDDASPDPEIEDLLASLQQHSWLRIVEHEENWGYTATANHGLALSGRADVVLLNSDAEVTPRWLENLRAAAYSGPRIATATPLSNNAGAFSAPEPGRENPRPPNMSRDDYARLVTQTALPLWPSVVTGNGFCMYLRRDAIDAVGGFDEDAFPRGYGEENDFCMRAVRAGWSHVVDDRSIVYHRRSASFGEEKTALLKRAQQILRTRYPEYRKGAQAITVGSEMLSVRYRLRTAAADVARAAQEGPPARVRPRALFVISTLTGGTPQTNADLMRGLRSRYDTLLLHCNGQRLELRRVTDEASEVIEEAVLDSPIDLIMHRSARYDAVVADWLVRYAVEIVHIRHLAWHSLGLPEACQSVGVPVVFSFHDFYMVCPSTKLLDHARRYCGGHCTPGGGTCPIELWPPGAAPPLKHAFIHRWQEMMDEALSRCDAFVTTSDSARETLCSVYVGLESSDFRVIPHGRDFAQFEQAAIIPQPTEPVRILVPGNIGQAKGATFLRELLAEDVNEELEIHVLGNIATELRGTRIVEHGTYERDAFIDRAKPIGAHFGAILSIWPETYCHTLTELWALGLPVLAFETGAVGERMRKIGGGWFIEPDPALALRQILRLAKDRGTYAQAASEVVAWQRHLAPAETVANMADTYAELYEDVLQRRRSFIIEDAFQSSETV